MNVRIKDILLRTMLLGSMVSCFTLPSYGMLNEADGEETRKRKTHMAKICRKDITSCSSLECKIKERNKLKGIASTVREVAWPQLQAFDEFFSVGTNDEKIWKKAAEQGHFAALYNLGGLSQKESRNKSFVELKTRYEGSQDDAITKAGHAFYWWNNAQNMNDAEAQFRVGFFYAMGHGVKQDDKKAMEWYLLAANKNYAGAQCAIGSRYCVGQGVEQNFEKAKEWSLKAANQNDVLAQVNMGALCFRKQQYEEALKWFLKAADQNYARAQLRIGRYYDWQENFQEAFKWLLMAAEQGDPNGEYFVGQYYYYGVDGIEKDSVKALEWFLKAAQKNYPQVQISIGAMYEAGDGTKRDPEEAQKWFNKAIAHDIKYANSIGDLYYNGKREIEKNSLVAFEWYLKAAEQNNAEAQIKVGILYEAGRVITRNQEEASKWFSKAATQDIKYAKEIGDFYCDRYYGRLFYEHVVEKDYTKALNWYLKAAEQNNAEAQIEVGTLYETAHNSEEAERWFTKAVSQNIRYAYNVGNVYDYGDYGIKRNRLKAFEWYLKAAEEGDDHAQFCIGVLYKNGSEVAQRVIKWIMGVTDHIHLAPTIKDFGYGQKSDIREIYMKFFDEHLKAAEEGDHRAQFCIGMLYESGTEIEKDSEKAEKWFIKATAQNPSYAEILGNYFYEGTAELKKDWGKALEWYSKAAEAGSQEAKERIEKIDIYLH